MMGKSLAGKEAGWTAKEGWGASVCCPGTGTKLLRDAARPPDKEMETKQNERNRAVLYFIGTIVALALFTGCGGRGGGDDDNGGPGTDPNPSMAPAEIQGTTLRLEETGGNQREIRFDAEGDTWSNSSSEGELQGTYIYQRGDSNNATLTLTTSETTQVINLSFASERNGVYAYTSGPPISGSFVLEETAPNPDPEEPPPTEPEPPPQTGLAPSTIAGRTMLGTRTYTSTGPSGQTHVYTFDSSTFHDSDPPEESDGNYIWTPSGDTAKLELDYTRPKFFAGDHHQLELTFTSETQGTFTSTYTRGDGTVIVINGTFEFP